MTTILTMLNSGALTAATTARHTTPTPASLPPTTMTTTATTTIVCRFLFFSFFFSHPIISSSRYRFRPRCLWPTPRAFLRVSRPPARQQIWVSRLLHTHLHGLRRPGRRTGGLSRLESRPPNPPLQRRNRRHLSRSHSKVWFSKGLYAEYGPYSLFFFFV